MPRKTKKNEEAAEISRLDPGFLKALKVLKEKFGKEGEIVQLKRRQGGWVAEIEVIEPSQYLQKLGIPEPVLERNSYKVVLDNQMRVLAFRRKQQVGALIAEQEEENY